MTSNIDDFNTLLQYLVGEFLKNHSFEGKLNDQRDDLLNEARIAAWKAIGDFDEDRKVKLSTWITSSVKWHLGHLYDKSSANKRGVLSELTDCEEDAPIAESQEIHDLEFLLSMKAVLTDEEFAVFDMRFVQDFSLGEIQKSLGLTRRGVESCLHHICQKYLSLEENLTRNLTQMQLRHKWLESSHE